MPVPEGVIIRTASGRAEIHLAAGDTVFLGEQGALRIATNRPYNFNRIEVLSGRAVIVTGEMGSQLQCEDAARLSDESIFHVDRQPLLGGTACDLKVYKGAAAVQLPTLTAVLMAGQSMAVEHGCGDMIPTDKFDIHQTDSLDEWSRRRIALRASLVP